MIVAPHRYDTDPVHGPTLEEQQRLEEDMYHRVKSKLNKMYDVFETQGYDKNEHNQNIANKNKWKDQPPEPN